MSKVGDLLRKVTGKKQTTTPSSNGKSLALPSALNVNPSANPFTGGTSTGTSTSTSNAGTSSSRTGGSSSKPTGATVILTPGGLQSSTPEMRLQAELNKFKKDTQLAGPTPYGSDESWRTQNIRDVSTKKSSSGSSSKPTGVITTYTPSGPVSTTSEMQLRQTVAVDKKTSDIQNKLIAARQERASYDTMSIDKKYIREKDKEIRQLEKELTRVSDKDSLKQRYLKLISGDLTEIGKEIKLDDRPIKEQIIDKPTLPLQVLGETAGLFLKKGVEGFNEITGIDKNVEAVKNIEGLKENLKKAESEYRDINRDIIPLEKDLNKLTAGKINSEGYFTGTEEEYKELLKVQNDLNKLYDKGNKVVQDYEVYADKLENYRELTTKTWNMFGYKKDIPVERLTSPFGYGAEAIKQSLIDVPAYGLGRLYGDITDVTGKVSKAKFQTVGQFFRGDITGGEFLSSFKKREPGVVWDLGTGTAREATMLDIKGSKESKFLYVQPTDVERFSKSAIGLGLYAVPYVGTGLFASEIGSSASEVGFSPTRFVREKPVETALIAGIGLTAGAIRTSKYLKQPIVKETATGLRVTNRLDEFFGKRISLSMPQKNILRFETLPSQRGITVKYLEIKAPKANLKASEIVGVGGKENLQQLVFPKQVVEQVSYAGRRTLVQEYTKPNIFRLTGKKGGLQTIYKGVPIDKLGREKAINILSNTFSEAEIKQILRYTAPQIQKQTFSGVLTSSKSKAYGEFIVSKETPSIFIDSTLGIKTRGAKTVKTTDYIDRTNLGASNKIVLGAEKSQSIITFPRKGVLDIKGFEFKQGITASESKGIKELTKNLGFERIESFSVSTYNPFDKRIFIDTSKTTIIRPMDTANKMGFKGKGEKSSQEYLEQLYSNVQAPVIKPLELKSVPKIKFPEIKQTLKDATPTIQESKWAGTGLYEYQTTYAGAKKIETMMGKNLQMTDFKLEQKFIEPVMQQKFIEPKVELKFGQPQLKKQFIEPKMDLKFIEPKLDSKFIEPKMDLKFMQPQLRQQFMQSQMEQVNVQKFAQALKTLSRTKLKKVKSKIFIPKIIIKPKSSSFKDVGSGTGLFEIFTKKKGQDISIGKVKTKEEAEEKLFGELSEKLRASGFVTFKGQKIGLGLKEGFRKSKVDPFRVVEKKTRRIKRKGKSKESFDIQKFRGGKGEW